MRRYCAAGQRALEQMVKHPCQLLSTGFTHRCCLVADFLFVLSFLVFTTSAVFGKVRKDSLVLNEEMAEFI